MTDNALAPVKPDRTLTAMLAANASTAKLLVAA